MLQRGLERERVNSEHKKAFYNCGKAIQEGFMVLKWTDGQTYWRDRLREGRTDLETTKVTCIFYVVVFVVFSGAL